MPLPNYSEETDRGLLEYWAGYNRVERDSREQRQRVEMELQKRMRERGATAIPHESLDVRLDAGTPSLDPSIIMMAHEFLPPEIIDEAYTPAHEETVRVADRWDGRKVATWSKYGTEVAAIVKRAKVYGDARLRITEKRVK